MLLLILGMVIFMAVHLIPTFVDLRQKLIAWKGETSYTVGYSCVAMLGLILIIIGKSRAARVPVWDAPDWAYHIAPIFMLAALILLPAAYMPTNLKRFIRHPFLTGIAMWGFSHLLVNGDLAAIILFGGFGAFALFDMWSSNRRGAGKSTTKVPIYRDIVLLAVGVIAFSAILHLHPYLFGVSAIP
ncbi:hypothetical protein D1AOALGA4SA_12982 [Olavius algarvensis Delta 1 endosymbiont]|nr:hypothetical protein D1AOALGA4SA_12982 [Olavius algarvensis Delta 1 endosymbiont]